MSVSAGDDELRVLLERGLAHEAQAPGSVRLIERRPFDRATSYALELLRVHLRNDECFEVLVKDFRSSQLPKGDITARAEREAAVYRELLDGSRTGTARLYGVARSPVRLLLEYVDGATLQHHDLSVWMDTAAWLGAFQSHLTTHAVQVGRCRPLILHDRAFFLEQACAARTAVTAFGPTAARRLDALLSGYPRLVSAMVDQPRTLVHGSFRPQNIIVSTADDKAPMRICPVDWELAGLGSPLYDLAFLAEGFHGPDLDRLLEEYLSGAGRDPPVPGGELTFIVDCFRIHKIAKSIGDAVKLAFRPAVVDKLLTMGEELRDRLA